MFIKKAIISNFRNIDKAVIDFEPLTIIRGGNHQGKSSIAQAIQLALTARCRGTDAQGRGATRKIQLGQTKCGISLDVQGRKASSEASLVVSYGPGRTGRKAESNPPSFLSWAERQRDRLSCCLDSAYFVNQTPEEQKSILASLVLPTNYQFNAEIRALVDATLRNSDGTLLIPAELWGGSPVKLIDEVYSTAFQMRTVSKTSLAGTYLPAEPEKPGRTMEEINAELEPLRKQVKKLSSGRASTLNAQKRARLEEEMARAKQDLDGTRQDIRDREAAISVESETLLSEEALNAARVVASKAPRFEELKGQIEEHHRAAEEQRVIREMFRSLLAVAEADAACPTCQQPVTPAWVLAKIEDCDGRLAFIEEREIPQSQAEIRELGDVAEAKASIETHEQTVEALATMRKAHAETGGVLARRTAEVERLNGELAATPEDAPPDTTELDTLNAKITALEGELGPAASYSATMKQREAAIASRDKWSQRVKDLDALCEYFGKDGIKAELIALNIDQFQTRVNSVLGGWGYAATIAMDPYSFEVASSVRELLPVEELSESEQLMFGAALQTAVAYTAGVRCALIDRADVFVGAERIRLLAGASKLISDGVLDQVIVLISDDATEVKAIKPREGVAWYRVDDGKASRV